LQEELDVLNVPVKLAFMLKEQLRQQVEQEQAASTQLTSDVLAQLPPVVDSSDAESLPADIMQRRMPAAQQESRSSSSSRPPTSVRSAPLHSLEPYSLQVTNADAVQLQQLAGTLQAESALPLWPAMFASAQGSPQFWQKLSALAAVQHYHLPLQIKPRYSACCAGDQHATQAAG
jgi:hypothetical protein